MQRFDRKAIPGRRRAGARSLRWLAALVLLCAAVPQAAAAREGDNVEASAGDLKIVHLWSTDPEGFMEAWRGPTPPTLRTSTRTQRNTRIEQFILYVNCTPDDAGSCRLEARVEITAPDGTPYGEPMTFVALPPAPAGPRDVIQLAPASIGLVIEDGEQLGLYRISLSVTDANAGTTATSVVHIEVDEAGT